MSNIKGFGNGSIWDTGAGGQFKNWSAFAALKADGSVVTWGDSDFGGDSSAVAHRLEGGVQAIYSNSNAFAALKADGSVVTWGDGALGGDSSAVADQLEGDVRAIYSNSAAFAALKVDGSVVTWGNVPTGGGTAADQLLGGVQAIYSNNGVFAALKADGSVVTWGNSSRGGDSSAVADQLEGGVQTIYSTIFAFAALKADGSVVTWGESAFGGDSTAVTEQLQDGVRAIYATRNAFAALKEDGSVVTWGDSAFGGDSSAVANQLQGGVQAIYATSNAFAALKANGSVVTWGDAFEGGDSSAVADQLQDGVQAVYSNYGAFAALKVDGSIVTWGSTFGGGDSSAVADQLQSGVKAIYSTVSSFAALKADGSVVTWGSTFGGGDSSAVADQLQGGVQAIYSGINAFAALKVDGSVVTWGDSASGGDSSAVVDDLQGDVVSLAAPYSAFASDVPDSGTPVSIDLANSTWAFLATYAGDIIGSLEVTFTQQIGTSNPVVIGYYDAFWEVDGESGWDREFFDLFINEDERTFRFTTFIPEPPQGYVSEEFNGHFTYGGGDLITGSYEAAELGTVTFSMTRDASPAPQPTAWSVTSIVGDEDTVFSITRDRTDTSETVYASTVQSPTQVNDGIYDGFADQMLVFAPGVASRQVTVSWNADRTIAEPKEFSLIIQADPTEPPSTFLARDFFTVQPADGVAPPPVDDDTVPPPADDDPTVPPGDEDPAPDAPIYRPTSFDLEYMAKQIAYGRGQGSLPEGYVEGAPIDGFMGFRAIPIVSDEGEPVLAVRGSNSFLDAVTNSNVRGVGYDQLAEVWPTVKSWLEQNPGAHITGHSLGGAQAQMVAAWATEAGIPIGKVATFNAPGINVVEARRFDPALSLGIEHYVASGDVVSMVGRAFLPGEVLFYNFKTISLPNLSDPVSFFGPFAHPYNAHVDHWAQPEMSTLRADSGSLIYGQYDPSINYRIASQNLTSADLGQLSFSHVYSGDGLDAEYMAFLLSLAKVGFPTISAGLATRGTAETMRTGIGFGVLGTVELVELGAAAARAVLQALDTMSTWATDTLINVGNWTVDTWRGLGNWVAETWEAVRDWTATQWDGVVGWGAKQWGLAKDFAADVWGDMRKWTSDVWESSLNWGVEAFNNVKSFGASVAQGIGDVANAVGDATAAVGTATMDFFRGSTTLWGMTSRGQDVEVVAADGGSATHATSTPAIMVAGAETTSLASAGAGSGFVLTNSRTKIEMSGGANTVFGDAGTLDNSELTGFGGTDRIIYANMTVGKGAEKVDGGSAIVSIDVDGDGVADTSLRLVGEYDLEAFRLLPHADGMALFYGPPPPDEVAEVRVAISGRDGAPLAGAELILVRPSGSGTLGQADEDGQVVFEVMRGVEGNLQAATEVATEAPRITALSALDALRMAVGLSPSWGPAGAMDYIAADFNGDGQVSAADALDILRVAVGLAAGDQPRWIFADTDADLSHVSRTNTQVEQGLRFDPITDDIADLGLTGILVGNVQEYA